MSIQSRSCVNCPSYKSPLEVATQLGKSIGAPACARYATVLGSKSNSDEQNEELCKLAAEKCASFGLDLNIEQNRLSTESLYVAKPLRSASVFDQARVAPNEVKSCGMCKFFMREDYVAETYGWTAGLCSAKGILIRTNMQRSCAYKCEYASFGPVRQKTPEWLDILKMYSGELEVRDPLQEFIKNVEIADPSAYKTDAPVTADDSANGVRAWRKITDPANPSRFTFLPIFREDFFSEDDRKLIPKTGDVECPHLYNDHFGGVWTVAVAWAELDETPAAWGEAGTGKTELYRHLAWLMGLPFRRISITASTEIDDIAGKMHYEPSRGTYFQYGRLPSAWTKPGVICVDEPNVGPAEVWQFLRPLTDNSKQLVLDQNRGEVIKRHKSAYLGMAMNPAWDAKNIGALEIGDADVNRLMHIFVPHPPLEVELNIIRSRVALDMWKLSKEQETMLMSIATDVRALIASGALSISWATRPQIKVARALRWFDPITAYKRAVADFLEPEAAEALLNVVRANQPTSVPSKKR